MSEEEKPCCWAPFGDGTVRPGETFYDKINATDYERCVLGPNGERGGTGEVWERVSHDRAHVLQEELKGKGADAWDAAFDECEIIHDVAVGPLTTIRRKK